MKLPNINYLVNKTKESFLAFPITIISAFIAVCISIYYVEFKNSIKHEFIFINLILTFYLGIPLYFCSTFLKPKTSPHKFYKYIPYVISTGILILVYFSLPNQEITFNTKIPYIRYAIFNMIAHLLVSFSLFIKKGQINGFWNYNKTLFIRFCTSFLYAIFLYVGLALAFSVLSFLFDFDIDGEFYFELFIIVFGLFNTWFFVAGITKETSIYSDITEYPKGLKIFTQYVLLPLLAIYLMILYAYGTKIIINQNLPKGLVSYLVVIISVLGIFTFLLIYPFGKQKGNEWINKANTVYYYLLLPLIILLSIAIYMRIADYGITINRYIICLFGFWVLLLIICFTLKLTNIKFIPISLATLLFICSFGPWSMFHISEKSQSNRLIKILETNEFIEHGKIINEVFWEQDSLPKFYSVNKNISVPVISDSIHNEIKSILDYLDDYHGMNSIDYLFKQDLKNYLKIASDSVHRINEARTYMKTLGLEYKHIYNFKADIENKIIKYSIKNQKVTHIRNYDYLTHFYKYTHNSNPVNFTINQTDYKVIFDDKKVSFNITSKTDTLKVSLQKLVNNLYAKYPKGKDSLSNDELHLTGKIDHFNVLINLENIGIDQKKDSIKPNYYNGNLLFKELVK